jgi:hypothetical protein
VQAFESGAIVMVTMDKMRSKVVTMVAIRCSLYPKLETMHPKPYCLSDKPRAESTVRSRRSPVAVVRKFSDLLVLGARSALHRHPILMPLVQTPYTRTISSPPFLINFSGAIFRTWPGEPSLATGRACHWKARAGARGEEETSDTSCRILVMPDS